MQRSPQLKPSGIAILAFSIFLLPAISHSASIYWDGGAGNTDWHSPNNWSNNLLPTIADDVTIDANVTVTAGSAAPISFNSLTIGGTNTATLKLSTGTASSGALIIRKGTLEQNSSLPLAFGSVSIESAGILTHTANTSTTTFGLQLRIASDLTLQSGGKIAADLKGYPKNTGPGAMSTQGVGASYGGMGMNSSLSLTYGSALMPTDLGSGGGGTGTSNYNGGPGGGIIKITAANMALNGTVDVPPITVAVVS